MKKLLILSLIVCAAQNAVPQPDESQKLPPDSIYADFNQFIEFLEETHPDPYSPFGGKPIFYQESKKIGNSLIADSVTSPKELAARISAFTSKLHDGHTFINSTYDPSETVRFAPIAFRHIADGLTIKYAPDSLRGYVGHKVLAVNGVDIERLKAMAAPLATAENESGEYENLRYILNDERRLKRLFGKPTESILLRLLSPEGTEEDVNISLIPYEEINRESLVNPESKLKLPKENFGYCFLDKNGETAYFRFNSVMSRDNFAYMKNHGMEYESQLRYYFNNQGQTMPENIEEAINSLPIAVDRFGDLLEEMKSKKSKNLIVDLRGNGGGWTPIVLPMLYQFTGKDILKMRGNIGLYRKLSPLYFKKLNISLDEFNKANGGNWSYNDYIISEDAGIDGEIPDEMADGFINSSMTLNKERLISQNHKPVYRPENIYVVTDGGTFSAAFHTAFYMRCLGAKIVGVPSSQAPNTFMEVTEFKLPRTGLSGSISNSLQLLLPADSPEARQLTPEIILDYENLKNYNFDPDAEILMLLDAIS